MTTTAKELDLVTSPPKLLAFDLLRRLSDEVTFKEIIDEFEILAGIREGLIAAREGRVTPHEEFEREIRSWLSK